jgi:hypothetical protein
MTAKNDLERRAPASLMEGSTNHESIVPIVEPPVTAVEASGGSKGAGSGEGTGATRQSLHLEEKQALKARMEKLSSELAHLRKGAQPASEKANVERKTAPGRSSTASVLSATAATAAARASHPLGSGSAVSVPAACPFSHTQWQQATTAAKALLASVASQAPVGVVGSVASGLALDASDVDLVVCTAGLASAAPRGDPPLVLLLCGEHLSGVRFRKQSKKAKRANKPPTRNKADMDAAIEATLEAHGFHEPRWARDSPLIRMVHTPTRVCVDLWMDDEAACVAESEAQRRSDAVRTVVAANTARGAPLADLHRVLRGAIGRELRAFEGSYGAAGAATGLGSYVTLLLVHRFLHRLPRAQSMPPSLLLNMMLTSLAQLGGANEDRIETLDELLPDAPVRARPSCSPHTPISQPRPDGHATHVVPRPCTAAQAVPGQRHADAARALHGAFEATRRGHSDRAAHALGRGSGGRGEGGHGARGASRSRLWHC